MVRTLLFAALAAVVVATAAAAVEMSQCDPNANYKLELTNFQMSPETIKPGDTVTSKYFIKTDEELKDGHVLFSLSYWGIQVMEDEMPLCEVVQQGGKSCPLQPGTHELVFTGEFPSNAPSGTYEGQLILLPSKDSKEVLACHNIAFQVQKQEVAKQLTEEEDVTTDTLSPETTLLADEQVTVEEDPDDLTDSPSIFEDEDGSLTSGTTHDEPPTPQETAELTLEQE